MRRAFNIWGGPSEEDTEVLAPEPSVTDGVTARVLGKRERDSPRLREMSKKKLPPKLIAECLFVWSTSFILPQPESLARVSPFEGTLVSTRKTNL